MLALGRHQGLNPGRGHSKLEHPWMNILYWLLQQYFRVNNLTPLCARLRTPAKRGHQLHAQETIRCWCV